jgi:hypothetical protein
MLTDDFFSILRSKKTRIFGPTLQILKLSYNQFIDISLEMIAECTNRLSHPSFTFVTNLVLGKYHLNQITTLSATALLSGYYAKTCTTRSLRQLNFRS